MSTVSVPGAEPAACECSSAMGIDALIGCARKVSGAKGFVLLLDPAEVAGRLGRRLLPAYLNAFVRFRDGMARSRTMQMETLMLAAGEKDIGKAADRYGAKDSNAFAVFATDGKTLERFLRMAGAKRKSRISLEFGLKEASEVTGTGL